MDSRTSVPPTGVLTCPGTYNDYDILQTSLHEQDPGVDERAVMSQQQHGPGSARMTNSIVPNGVHSAAYLVLESGRAAERQPPGLTLCTLKTQHVRYRVHDFGIRQRYETLPSPVPRHYKSKL